MTVLLIYPPVAKPSEPPAGVSRLAGFLKANSVEVHAIDASLEGLHYLIGMDVTAKDTWTKRALNRAGRNLDAMKDSCTYDNPDRYSQAVNEIERVLWAAGGSFSEEITIGLADYQDRRLTPARSSDLLFSADEPENNPFHGYYLNRIIPEIERISPDIVGISINYLSQALCAFALIGLIKRHFSGMHIAIGGGLVTAWTGLPHRENLFEGLVDDLVAGNGESYFSERLCLNDSPPVCYDYDFSWCKRSGYLSSSFIMPFATSSACCWNRCSFCQERASSKEPFSCTPDQALQRLSSVTDENSPGLIHLVDSTIPPAILKRLADSHFNAPWYGFTRINRELTDKDFCVSLRRSGCRMLKLGLESGDQGVLDALDKGIDISVASDALAALKSAGISTYVYLLFGTPPEDHSSALKTIEFVRENCNVIDYINAAIFNLPAACINDGNLAVYDFYDGDLGLYKGFLHSQGWERKKVRTFIDREFRRDAAVSKILRRTPPVFTSNHAPLFYQRYFRP